MTEPTARERIADVLRNAVNEAIDDMEFHRAEETADRIIAIVQQALTADDVIEAFQEAEAAYEYDVFDGWFQAYQFAMKASLAKAFGADDDGGER